MKTTKFNKLVQEATKEYKFKAKLKQIVIEEFGKTRIAAIYCIRKTDNSDLHYTIYYAYDHMRTISQLGHFKIKQSDNNSYREVYETLKTFA